MSAAKHTPGPGPWDVHAENCYAGQTYWTVGRYNPEFRHSFSMEYVFTRTRRKRWYDKDKAEKHAAKLNAAIAKATGTPPASLGRTE